ncbi:MAG TPA: DinB family protein [Methylomirabilota bacterium]|nr:DinB family protein [Methylomirabilota bacterium]
MTFLDHARLMATYNTWMNRKLYDTAAHLEPSELARERGAFFGSILGTMNHLAVADILWLQRFRNHPAARPALDTVLALPSPTSLDQILETDLAKLRALRVTLDRAFEDFVATLDEAGLDVVVSYARGGGERQAKLLGPVLGHVFNHQTHHRGQLSTLLSQVGLDIGVTDLNALIPSRA